MRARIFVSAVVLSAVAYACGGVDSDLLNGAADDGGGSGDDDVVRDSGLRDSSISGNDSGGGSGDGGGGGTDSGSDTGVITHPKVIQCGTNDTTTAPPGTVVTCNATDPTCCASQYPFDMVNPLSYRCTTNGAACADFDSGSIPIECRSSADCPGTAPQCCGHEITYNTFPADPITIYDSVRCQAACPLLLIDGGENANRLFCDPAGAACPVGDSCVASTLLPGFNVCGTP